MKRMKKWLSVLAAAAVAGTMLAGCGGGTDKKAAGGEEEKVLTVYTARSESLNNLVIPNFEKDTGIKVNVIVAGTGPLLKRVASEKGNPQGDILWASDQMTLESQKDLFMEYVSPEDANMMEAFRNKTGYFSPAFADPTVMIVNKNLAGDMKIDSFEDLLNPALKGKIAFGDPAASNSALQSLIAMLYAKGTNGDPMSDTAWAYVDQFIANLDGKILNSSGGVH